MPTVYREPKGLYVLEALANGIPVVQPRHGAFPEMLEATGGGLLVEPGDPEDLARALEELMKDPAGRMQLAQRRTRGRPFPIRRRDDGAANARDLEFQPHSEVRKRCRPKDESDRDLRSPATGSSVDPSAFILQQKNTLVPPKTRVRIARDAADPSATSHAVPAVVAQVAVAVADRDRAAIVAGRRIGLKTGKLLTANCRIDCSSSVRVRRLVVLPAIAVAIAV